MFERAILVQRTLREAETLADAKLWADAALVPLPAVHPVVGEEVCVRGELGPPLLVLKALRTVFLVVHGTVLDDVVPEVRVVSRHAPQSSAE